MVSYTKFIGALNSVAAHNAARHFESSGFKTKILSSPETTELGKLAETTYFGMMIAWAQEVERYCDRTGTNYDEVISLFGEVKFFPPIKYFPGIIGGHCVMRNIKILSRVDRSALLRAIEASNEKKTEREVRQARGGKGMPCARGHAKRRRRSSPQSASTAGRPPQIASSLCIVVTKMPWMKATP